MDSILSIDVETNNLDGDVLAIAVVDKNETPVFLARVKSYSFMPEDDGTPSWVEKNVWTECQSIKTTYETPDELVETFGVWWMTVKPMKPVVIAHCPNPVETQLWNQWAKRDLKHRKWDRPMNIHDVGTLLLVRGEDPTSVDKYIEKHKIAKPESDAPHNPLYDAIAALRVWKHVVG